MHATADAHFCSNYNCRVNSVNTILAQGAALAGVTLLAGFDEDITAAVPHGAQLELDPVTRTLQLR